MWCVYNIIALRDPHYLHCFNCLLRVLKGYQSNLGTQAWFSHEFSCIDGVELLNLIRKNGCCSSTWIWTFGHASAVIDLVRNNESLFSGLVWRLPPVHITYIPQYYTQATCWSLEATPITRLQKVLDLNVTLIPYKPMISVSALKYWHNLLISFGGTWWFLV